MSTPRHVWFPAKRYGWGWGVPVTWEGWVVMILWVVVLALGSLAFVPERPLEHAFFVAVMIALLIAVCRAKGEPPKWRWGEGRK
jgi:hypothetical protein